MQRILVTGGCGFIGSHFVRHLLKSYNDFFVINVDKLTYAGNRKNLADVEGYPNYYFVLGNICDEKLMDYVFEHGIDYVVNFAAESHVDRSISNSKIFVETNVLGTQILLDKSLKYGVKKFIQVSTDEVYGSLELDDRASFTELSPLAPRNPYAASKAGADLLVKSFFSTYDIPVIITRCSNNYGENQHQEKLIPKTILSAIKGKPVKLYGDGLYVREWIYVKDHCRAIMTILQDGKAGEVYNIGTGYEVSNRDVAKSILKLLGKSEDMIEYSEDRLGHDRRYSLDCSKLEAQLEWKAEIDLHQGLVITVDWYKRKWHKGYFDN